MTGTINKFFVFTWNVRSLIFIRLAVGLIFLTQGILKYIDPHMGRFASSFRAASTVPAASAKAKRFTACCAAACE